MGKPKCRAIEHMDFLSLLSKAKRKHQRSQILDLANKEQIEAILECIQNVHNRNVPITDRKQAKRLRRYSTLVQKLRKPKTNWQEKKKLLSQSGGGVDIGGIIKTILPLTIKHLKKIGVMKLLENMDFLK
jgi:hypothetical protein